MEIRVREDSIEIEGYVNAVERNSKLLKTRLGSFLERICKGVFERAISKNDIVLLLNHNWDKILAKTSDGTLHLQEDAIGLKARAKIVDPDVVEKAKNGELVGWSFGFSNPDEEIVLEDEVQLRRIKDLTLHEVSLLDSRKTPAYEGTLVVTREEVEMVLAENLIQDAVVHDLRSMPPEPDYTKYEQMIEEMKKGTR